MDNIDWIVSIFQSTIRMSVPLILTALAGLYAERSGVVDIGLEGKLLAGAFAGASAAAVTGSAFLGILAAIGCAVMFSAVHGYASISQRGNQIVSGVAINFIAMGATVIIGQAWFSMAGRTPSLGAGAKLETITLPFADAMLSVPFIGVIYAKILSGHFLLTYFAYAMIPVTWWILYRTRFGLRLRAVGENPGAVDTAGISVVRLRYMAVLLGGVFVGLAGAFLSMAVSAGFTKGMSAGKGFIALAALVFANWKPKNILLTCLLFGFLDSLSIAFQGKTIPLIGAVPVQLWTALPYILTVILLAGFIGKAIPPKASGNPYVKER
ncbi:ABC transporter permease [Rhizobium sp. KVB221]|uniref:ABC transporter permease n=1 Tax=Rhizobium setariae TaxID=2801340 RepID=A0A936YUD5_9HYPH|nr:ABC transporter permease [Rhizobium setariae]MBL0375197.1 ABC transporter permease [Rhizobium setariae]